MWGLVFPGQGSQSVGMGRFLWDNFAVTRHLFEEASDTLKVDFKRLCFEGPNEELVLTENTQPALLLVSYATFRVLSELVPIKIMAGAGHSVGEYAAVVAAEAVDFTQALRAVRVRGQSMQKAVPIGQGGMLAVMGLEDEQVQKLCKWVQETSGFQPLEPANFNAPGQVVVSGSAQAIEWLRAHVSTEIFLPQQVRVRLIPLNVSAPFHCSLMKPAEEQMKLVLSDMAFKNAAWPIVQNVSAQPTVDADLLRTHLISQVSGAVRWVECMTQLSKLGVKNLIECGPGKVLAGLAKKIDSDGLTTFNITTLDELKQFEAKCQNTSKGH